MKKILIAFTTLLTLSTSAAFANGPAENTYSFNSTDNEVAMNVERTSGEVKLNILITNITQFDHILIERSAENPNYFGKCKYISCADAKIENGKLVEKDRYPYSAAKDVYYRIKTVTKDGVERAYPPVLLAASVQ